MKTFPGRRFELHPKSMCYAVEEKCLQKFSEELTRTRTTFLKNGFIKGKMGN